MMEFLYERCCGINIHKSVAVVCVIVKSKVDLSVVALQMAGREKRADGRNEDDYTHERKDLPKYKNLLQQTTVISWQIF
jgi:hypothetical protein